MSLLIDATYCTPFRAAHQGLSLKMDVLTAAFQNTQKQADFVVVEGAGGFIIPLIDHEDLSSFAAAIELPIILVVGMKLGCINHALLTYEVIKAHKLKLAGWIANSLSEEMLFLKENLQTLKTRISSPFLGYVPPLPEQLRKPLNSPYSIEALNFAAQHIQLPSSQSLAASLKEANKKTFG